MKKNDEIRDIYQSENHDFEKDFTPQVTPELIALRKRDLQRNKRSSLILGVAAIMIAIALITIVTHDLLSENRVEERTATKDAVYIPRHNLPLESAWVMAYDDKDLELNVDSIGGEKPLSIQWIKRAAYHIVMGQQALSLNEIDSANQHFEIVAAIYPDVKGLRNALGSLYLKQENFEKSAEQLELAFAEEETFEIANNLGSAYIGLKNFDDAEKYLTIALGLQPENPSTHINLAHLYKDMEQADKAIYHFEKYIDLVPSDMDVLQSYAVYLAEEARWEEASTFLTKLTQELPDVAPIYFLLAQVQIQNNQPDLAVTSLQRGIQLIDPSLALAWMSQNEFSSLRDSSSFKTLVDKLEISAVSMQPLK